MTVAAQKPVQRIFWLEGFIWNLASMPTIIADVGRLQINDFPLFVFELPQNDHDEINSCPNA